MPQQISKAPLLCVHPSKILKKPAVTVTDFGESLQKTVELLTGIMKVSKGVGIAANQCFLPSNVFVALIDEVPTAFINSEIVDFSEEFVESTEGCLSIPDFSVILQRHKEIELRHQNLKGETFVTRFEGQNAVVIQHEMDHLTGALIIDKISKLRQDIVTRHCKKLKKRHGLI